MMILPQGTDLSAGSGLILCMCLYFPTCLVLEGAVRWLSQIYKYLIMRIN